MKNFPGTRVGRSVCGQEVRFLAGQHVTDVLNLVDTGEQHAHRQSVGDIELYRPFYVTKRVNKELLSILKDFHALPARLDL